MRLLIAATLAAAACGFAQIHVLEMSFEGVNCLPCVESMPARAQRIRGVESAKVDAATGVLSLQLSATNRVRVEQIRDMIQQDGTKATRVPRIEVSGTIEQAENGIWMLRIPQHALPLELKSFLPLKTGEVVKLSGRIEDLKRSPLQMQIPLP